jgi:phage baseplate assembly protein W
MSNGITYGISFPFVDSFTGRYLDVTNSTEGEIRGSLVHLLLTRRGSRYFLPNFGTRLYEYIFEHKGTTINQYGEREFKVTNIATLEHTAKIKIDYRVLDSAFESQDFIIINI